jgi:hypothetical protein
LEGQTGLKLVCQGLTGDRMEMVVMVMVVMVVVVISW